MAAARLAPLSEDPINQEEEEEMMRKKHRSRRNHSSFHSWLKNQLPTLFGNNCSDLKILLSVLGCPLSPVTSLPKQLSFDVASSAQYIIRQFRATTGCDKLEGPAARSTFVSGSVRMEMTHEHGRNMPTGGGGAVVASIKGRHHKGCFVVWQMVPDMWLIELTVSGHRIVAGSNGKVAWRRTPWLGAHAARGAVRPLRRALQGLDPVTIANVFSTAQHIGEKHIGDEECFVLESLVDSSILSSWSDGNADVIKHRMLGFFSQRSGLLVRLEDNQLTRIQSPGAEAMYWEMTIVSCMEAYQRVDGVAVAHAGRSTVNLLRFGTGVKDHRVLKKMEETWIIDDVQYNVPGLSADCFIPPQEIQKNCLFETAPCRQY